MTDVIQLLPDSLANQIAAGEVVQRPASVVKELLENAIDAKSKNITLIVKDAGKALIQIIDDGQGMSETDARMCFERHATSKIRKTEDLFSIRTMGFRGEALASISAVAQVELKTKRDEDTIGTQIIIDGSKFKSQEGVSTPTGTNIVVKNLFYNVPARRNFLKSNPVELRHIMDEFHRIALSNPEVSFYLFQNDLEVYHLKAGKLSQRIVHLFGKNYREQLVPCQEEVEEIKITGYIGKPENAKKSRGEQYFFVNNRFIRSSYLNHAVVNAYHGLIPENSFPFFVLFIELDPKHVDINVHPTKTEVKFDDERTVYSIVKSTVKKSLGTFNLTPSMDYSVDTNFIQNFRKDEKQENSGGFTFERPEPSQREKDNLKNWENLYFDAFENERFEKQVNIEKESKHLTFESAANKFDEGETRQVSGTEKALFQVDLSYIVTSVKSGLMIIDQQNAHERILFEKFKKNLENQQGHVQQFLFPETIELNAADYTLLKDLDNEVRNLGFSYEQFGKNTIALNGSPTLSSQKSGKELLLSLLEDYKSNHADSTYDKRESISRAMSKNAAIKKGKSLSKEEMQSLIDQLFGCENPNYTPNGEKTYYILEAKNIERMFN